MAEADAPEDGHQTCHGLCRPLARRAATGHYECAAAKGESYSTKHERSTELFATGKRQSAGESKAEHSERECAEHVQRDRYLRFHSVFL